MSLLHARFRTALRAAVLIALASAHQPPAAAAQPVSQFVYQVRATECGAGQKGRRLTGFREAGRRGIVTALHGVVGCENVTASNAQDSRNLGQLRIVQVDVARDLAVLSSAPLSSGGTEGIPLGQLPSPGSPLRVFGYPHGIPSVLVSNLSMRQQAQVRLSTLLPLSMPLAEFRERNSPRPDILVLSIEGHLTVGHSGAPILNGTGQLVGVANGGLAMGASEITWAIPYTDGSSGWRSAAAEAEAVARLGARNAEVLFAAAADVPTHANRTCFGRTFHFIRSATLGELVTNVDDPATYQSLIQMMGLHGANLTYLLYRDLPQVGGAAQPVATLAVPEGWALAPVGSRCVATAPQLPGSADGPPIEVEFDLRALTGPNPSPQIEQIVVGKEASQFFSENYTIDAWASNPFPNLVMHRGLIARRKTYIRVDRRCGPGPFPPQSAVVPPQMLTPAVWSLWPTVTAQNAAFCTPPRAIYPDIWVPMMTPRIPAQYVRAAGFGSFMGSDEHVLLSTLKLDDPGLQLGLIECSERLSRSEDCRRLYARQRQWAAAVIAATVSTLTPSSADL